MWDMISLTKGEPEAVASDCQCPAGGLMEHEQAVARLVTRLGVPTRYMMRRTAERRSPISARYALNCETMCTESATATAIGSVGNMLNLRPSSQPTRPSTATLIRKLTTTPAQRN